jgi:conjugal transfer pilus assembly protein TraB
VLAKLKSIYDSLSPTTKKKISLLIAAGFVIFVGLSVYKIGDNKSSQSHPSGTVKQINLDPKLVQNTIYEETRKKTSEMERRQKELEKHQEETNQKIDQLISKLEVNSIVNASPHGPVSCENRPRDVRGQSVTNNNAFPPIPNPDLISYGNSTLSPPPPPEPPKISSSYNIIGNISMISNKSTPLDSGSSKEGDNKKNELKKKYYLPPCFLQATLLSGLRAPTMGDAKKDPVPILLRVKTPAILPNHVRSNISGCYIIAEGSGKLSDERVHVRLLSLSCIDKNSNSIIDQNITGFVQDEDGVVGLSGIVTAKFGSKIARAFLAGALEGAGDAMQTASSTVETSPIGTTQIISETDTRNIARSAVGGGLSTASKELQSFYYALAKESMPVLEVGNNKPCTVVISKGVYLDVKNEEILK